MYWLSFLLLSLLLYTPPFSLGQQVWQWALRRYWWVPLLGWPLPASFGYLFWLVAAYLALGTALHLAHHRLPADNRLRRLAEQVSRGSLGGVGVIACLVAVLIILLAWPVLPAYRLMYGWPYAISTPVAALAALYLLAEAVRRMENSGLADRAFENWRRLWLTEHGHYR